MIIEIGSKFEIRTISSVNGGDDKNTKTCRDGGGDKSKIEKSDGTQQNKNRDERGGRNSFPKSVTVPQRGGSNPKSDRNVIYGRPLRS